MSKKTEYTSEGIQKLVEKQEKSAAISDLRDQMEEHWKLYTLKRYEGEEGHQSYTSPSPKNDFLKVFHGVNKASLTWQIVVPEEAPEKEREGASKGEEILSGIIAQVDRAERNRGEPPLRESLAWYGCARGMSGMRCLIYATQKGGKKETEIDIRPIDPMNLVWQRGSEGLVWAAIKYPVSGVEVEDRYEVEVADKDKDVVIIDFFDKAINAVVLVEGVGKGINSQFLKEPEEHGLDHVPIYLGFAGSMPTVYTRDNELALKYRAASVWSASSEVYEAINKQISFVMDIAEKSVAGTLVYESDTGERQIVGDPFGAWQVINLKTGEKISALLPPPVPAASGMIMSVLDRDKQASTIPYPIGYGIDPSAHSGAALAMMNDNTRSIYSPYCSLVEDAYRWLCEEILSQFKAKGGKVTLKGWNNQSKFFVKDITPGDIQDEWYVVVKCEPKLPRDEVGEMQMALAATNPRGNGRPLLSDLTALEKVVKIQNPDAEIGRIDDQLVKQMIEKIPSIAIRKAALELLKKGDREAAMELLSQLPHPGGKVGQTVPGQQGVEIGAPGKAPGVIGSQGSIPPQAQQILMALSQELGIPPEELAKMQPAQVEAMMREKQGQV